MNAKTAAYIDDVIRQIILEQKRIRQNQMSDADRRAMIQQALQTKKGQIADPTSSVGIVNTKLAAMEKQRQAEMNNPCNSFWHDYQMKQRPGVTKIDLEEECKVKTIVSELLKSKGSVKNVLPGTSGNVIDDEGLGVKALYKIDNIKTWNAVNTSILGSTGKDVPDFLRSYMKIAQRLEICSHLYSVIQPVYFDAILKKIVTYSDIKQVFQFARMKRKTKKTSFNASELVGQSEWAFYTQGLFAHWEPSAINMSETFITDPNLYATEFAEDMATFDFRDITAGMAGKYLTYDEFVQAVRDYVYTTEGIVVTTITSAIPLTKIPTMFLFGMLVAEDVKKINDGDTSVDTLLNLFFDSLGVMIGGGSSVVRSAMRPIVSAIGRFSKNMAWTRKEVIALIPVIKKTDPGVLKQLINVLSSANWLSNTMSSTANVITKFLNKLGFKSLAKTISSILNKTVSLFKSYVLPFGKGLIRIIQKIIAMPGEGAETIIKSLGLPAGKVIPGIPKIVKMGINIGFWLETINTWSGMNNDDLEKYIGDTKAQEAFVLENFSDSMGMLDNVLGFPARRTIPVYKNGTDQKPAGNYTIQRTQHGNYNFVPILVLLSNKSGQLVECTVWKTVEDFENRNIDTGTANIWIKLTDLKLVNKKPLKQYPQPTTEE